MNTTLKIQELWKYLGIQDDEILIIRHFNRTDNKDEFLIVESTRNGLKITATSNLPALSADTPFQIIQQRDSSGKYVIPLVNQLIKDKVSDY